VSPPVPAKYRNKTQTRRTKKRKKRMKHPKREKRKHHKTHTKEKQKKRKKKTHLIASARKAAVKSAELRRARESVFQFVRRVGSRENQAVLRDTRSGPSGRVMLGMRVRFARELALVGSDRVSVSGDGHQNDFQGASIGAHQLCARFAARLIKKIPCRDAVRLLGRRCENSSRDDACSLSCGSRSSAMEFDSVSRWAREHRRGVC